MWPGLQRLGAAPLVAAAIGCTVVASAVAGCTTTQAGSSSSGSSANEGYVGPSGGAANSAAIGGASGTAGPVHVSVTGPAAVPPSGAAAGPQVQPGYDSPVHAVEAFYQALLGGNTAKACAYVAKTCPSFGSHPVTGNVSIVDAVTSGSQALVEVSGSLCVGGTCQPLSDRVMMPTAPGSSFTSAWTSLTSGIYGWAGSPLPCVRDAASGQWRVQLPS